MGSKRGQKCPTKGAPLVLQKKALFHRAFYRSFLAGCQNRQTDQRGGTPPRRGVIGVKMALLGGLLGPKSAEIDRDLGAKIAKFWRL